MTRLFYDIEANGYYRSGDPSKDLTEVHCIVTRDLDTDVVWCYHNNQSILPRHGSLEQGCVALGDADLRVAHNGLAYDEPVLDEFLDNCLSGGACVVRDSIVLSHMVWPELKNTDAALRRLRASQGHPEFPSKLTGSHSLEAWGHRLKNYKGSYEGGFEEFSQDMLDYCIQDTAVGAALTLKALEHLKEQKVPEAAIETEHLFQTEMVKQRWFGINFDTTGAWKLSETLSGELADIDAELAGEIAPWVKTWVTPKKQLVRHKEVPFNPASRQQIGRLYTERYGWRPAENRYGKDGHPTVDEATFAELAALKLPYADLFAKRMLVTKRLSQVAVAATANSKPWVDCVDPDGRIRPYVNHYGTVTGRCSHSRPNITQVPRVTNPYGAECRALWGPPEGWQLVGADAKGLELRIMAHYLARFDGGAYGKEVCEGDPHTRHQEILGFTMPGGRDRGKTWFYANIYGAGDIKLGQVEVDGIRAITEAQAKKLGRATRTKFRQGMSGFDALTKALMVHLTGYEDPGYRTPIIRPYLRGLEGRYYHVRSTHSAINTLFQAAGAVVMKLAVVIANRLMASTTLKWGEHYAQIIMAHDEMQWAVRPEFVERAKRCMEQGIIQAGEALGLAVPMAADVKVGATWKDTH